MFISMRHDLGRAAPFGEKTKITRKFLKTEQGNDRKSCFDKATARETDETVFLKDKESYCKREICDIRTCDRSCHTHIVLPPFKHGLSC